MQFEEIREVVLAILQSLEGRFTTAYQICRRIELEHPLLWNRLTQAYPGQVGQPSMGMGAGTQYSPASFICSCSEFVQCERAAISQGVLRVYGRCVCRGRARISRGLAVNLGLERERLTRCITWFPRPAWGTVPSGRSASGAIPANPHVLSAGEAIVSRCSGSKLPSPHLFLVSHALREIVLGFASRHPGIPHSANGWQSWVAAPARRAGPADLNL